jgi:drug/metabolite transporter (DMT)-like permease
VPARTWLAILIALAGIVVMFGGTADAGQLTGNLLALGVSVCFAAQLTMLRKFHATVDMLPMVMIAGLWSLLPAFVMMGPVTASARDLGVLVIMGCVQLGAVVSWHRRFQTLTATELGLLALLEPILGPIWVWALLGEHPGKPALVGGALVLSAVIANQALAARRGRSQEAAQPLPGP